MNVRRHVSRIVGITSATALALAANGCGSSGDSASGNSVTKSVVFDSVTASSSTPIVVKSDAVSAGGTVPVQFTASGAKETPKIEWTGAPTSTKEIEVIVEDPDAPGSAPYVHLLLEGISPTATSTALPAVFGPNSEGKDAYAPIDPPSGPAHHYHFEVFALDELLPTRPLARDPLLKALAGHVLAKGEIIGAYGK